MLLSFTYVLSTYVAFISLALSMKSGIISNNLFCEVENFLLTYF